jgi:hypothetical protein
MSYERFTTNECKHLVAASIVNVQDVNHVSQFTDEFKQEPAHATVHARTPATRDSAPDKPSFQLQALHLAAHRSAQAGIADLALCFQRLPQERTKLIG